MTFVAALIGFSTIAFLINGLINYQPVKFSEALLVFTFGFTFIVLAYANFKSGGKPHSIYDYLAISIGGVFILNGAIFFEFYEWKPKYSNEYVIVKLSEEPILFGIIALVNLIMIIGALIYFFHLKKRQNKN